MNTIRIDLAFERLKDALKATREARTKSSHAKNRS
jgi:hypothetical protein